MLQNLLFIIFLIISLLNALYAMFVSPIILLTENQILYTFSTIAQVTASMFGLILAAYAIINPKLEEKGNENQELYDYIKIYRNKCFKNIVQLSIFCVITILLSLLCINTYIHLPIKWVTFFINQTIFCCVLSTISFTIFGCNLLNPKALSKIGQFEKKEIEKEYYDSDKTDNFRSFVSYYNKLEDLITRYANELMQQDENQDSNNLRHKRVTILQALDLLLLNNIISKDTFYKIDELRRYRNALVHSLEDQTVKTKIFNQLKIIYKSIDKVYQQRTDTENQKIAISQFNNYINNTIKNNTDIALLKILKQNKNCSIKEIAETIGVSKSYISKKIKSLYDRGLL